MKHTIKATDFDGYEATHILASSAGGNTSKRLTVITKLPEGMSYFRVSRSGVIVLDAANFADAIEKYNELD